MRIQLMTMALVLSASAGCKKHTTEAPAPGVKDAGPATGPTATMDAGPATGSDTMAGSGSGMGSHVMAGSGSDMGSGKETAVVPTVVVSMVDAKGADVGKATLSAAPNHAGVTIELDLKGLPPGDHAIHVHETPTCTGPDFKSAGGHWNPSGKHHGMQNAEGPHAGDMPNFAVAADGTAKTTIVAPGVTWDKGPMAVWGPGGTALVIHASADDMKTDPSGNAGERIACGRISVP